MVMILLILNLVWNLFWIAYVVYVMNSGQILYKKGLVTKYQKPMLYKAELGVSIIWCIAGYASLYSILMNSL